MDQTGIKILLLNKIALFVIDNLIFLCYSMYSYKKCYF